MEYIIVGDTASYKGCLVAVCGGDRTAAIRTNGMIAEYK